MTYNVFSGTLNPTHFTSLHLVYLLTKFFDLLNDLEQFLGDRFQNASPHAIGPLSVLSSLRRWCIAAKRLD